MLQLKSSMQLNSINILPKWLPIQGCCGKLHAAFNQGSIAIEWIHSFRLLKAHFFASVAELVDALDLGSSVLGCESSSLSTRTILSS